MQEHVEDSKHSDKLFTSKQNFITDLYKLHKLRTSSPRVSVYIRNRHYSEERINEMPHEKHRRIMSIEKYI